jgi:nucleoside-diphosphate-sugar epimerase
LGFLGSYLSEYIVSAGYDLIIVDRFDYPTPDNFDWLVDNAMVVEDSVSSPSVIEKVAYGCDVHAVIHLAALVGERLCKNNVVEAVATNYMGTKNIIQGCNKIGAKLIFASTCSNYGVCEGEATENTPLKPMSLYARTKVESEKAIISKSKYYTIFRFGTLFGRSPRMRWDLMLNEWAWEAHHKGKIELYNPKANRPLLHLYDACNSVLTALNRKEIRGVYNVAYDNFSKMEIAEAVRKEYQCEITLSGVENDRRDYQVDTFKFPYKPMIDLKTGLKELMPIIDNPKTGNDTDFRIMDGVEET